jgi:hypothetical protein
MTQTIDVTGLTPEAVQVLETIVGMLRGKTHEMNGSQSKGEAAYTLRGTVVRYDRPFDPVAQDEWEAVAYWPGPPVGECADDWTHHFQKWIESHPKRAIEIDYDRGSI